MRSRGPLPTVAGSNATRSATAPGEMLPAPGQAVDLRRVSGEAPDGVLQAQHPELADPALQEVGREVRVAELAGVRAGVGKPKQHRRILQQPADLLLVIVDHHHPEAGREILGQRQLDRDVECRPATLGGELAEGGPVAKFGMDAGFLDCGVVELAAPLLTNPGVGPLAPLRIAIQRRPAVAFEREDLPERGHVRQRCRIGKGHLGDDGTAGHLREDERAGAARGCHPALEILTHCRVFLHHHDGRPGERPADVERPAGRIPRRGSPAPRSPRPCPCRSLPCRRRASRSH